MNRIKKDGNYIQNLTEYAKRNLKKGYSNDSLRWALINQGHSRIEVDKALSVAQAEVSKEAMVNARKSQESSPLQPSMPAVSVEPEPKSFWKRWFG